MTVRMSGDIFTAIISASRLSSRPDTGIEPLPDDIGEAVLIGDLQCDIGIGIQEIAEPRGKQGRRRNAAP